MPLDGSGQRDPVVRDRPLLRVPRRQRVPRGRRRRARRVPAHVDVRARPAARRRPVAAALDGRHRQGDRGRRHRRGRRPRRAARRRDPRRVGRKHRYGYFVQTRDNPETVEFGGLIKRDYRTGRVEVWDPGPARHAGEWLFVPEGSSPDDDAGYLLTYLHDDARNASELVIVDASGCAGGSGGPRRDARSASPTASTPPGYPPDWLRPQRCRGTTARRDGQTAASRGGSPRSRWARSSCGPATR